MLLVYALMSAIKQTVEGFFLCHSCQCAFLRRLLTEIAKKIIVAFFDCYFVALAAQNPKWPPSDSEAITFEILEA